MAGWLLSFSVFGLCTDISLHCCYWCSVDALVLLIIHCRAFLSWTSDLCRLPPLCHCSYCLWQLVLTKNHSNVLCPCTFPQKTAGLLTSESQTGSAVNWCRLCNYVILCHFPDAWWVRISLATHYCIHMIINSYRYKFWFTGRNQAKHAEKAHRSQCYVYSHASFCSAMLACYIKQHTHWSSFILVLLGSVWTNGHKGETSCVDIVESLCEKGLIKSPLWLHCAIWLVLKPRHIKTATCKWYGHLPSAFGSSLIWCTTGVLPHKM